MTSVLRGFFLVAALGLHPDMASSPITTSTPTERRTRDEPDDDSEPNGQNDDLTPKQNDNDPARDPPGDGSAGAPPSPREDLQAVIDQYERLLEQRTEELERSRRSASEAGVFSRLRRWLRSIW